MAAIQMRITFQFVSESDSEHVFDSVATALFDQEATNDTLTDADVTSRLSENTISMAIVGTGDTIDAASTNASSAIRAAIHASGGATPGWDHTVEAARHQAVFTFVEQTAVIA